ncbi:MAG: DegV family protein [Solirubrobacteraceae bacterium]
MPGVAVVTDTCHYMPAEMVAANDVTEVSLHVHWAQGDTPEADLPSFGAYYDSLRTAEALPTTSQPSVGEFLAAYEPLLDAGQEIVSVHLSAGVSGTCESARQARAQLGAREERIHVVDSRSACGGEGLCVMAAVGAAREGLDGAQVAQRVGEAREELVMRFAVDTLEYLRRGGRIGSAQAWVGSALKIKPILALAEEITPVERVRTAGRAFQRMVDYLTEFRDSGRDGWVVQHIQAPDEARRLADRGREIIGCEPLFVSEVGPVIGTHAGPGLLGVGGVPARLLGGA